MIQVQLNLPELDNQGKSNRRYLNQLEVEASKKFGGLPSFKGQGKWLNANKLYDEQINIYQVAIKKLQKKIRILQHFRSYLEVARKNEHVKILFGKTP